MGSWRAPHRPNAVTNADQTVITVVHSGIQRRPRPQTPRSHPRPSAVCTAFLGNPLKPAIPGTPSLPSWLPLLSHRFVCFPFSRPSPVNKSPNHPLHPPVCFSPSWGGVGFVGSFKNPYLEVSEEEGFMPWVPGLLGVCRFFFLEDLYQSEFLRLGGSWR